MAEDNEEVAEEREEPKKKKGKNMLLVIIVAVAVLAGGAGAFFFFTKSGGEKAQKKESAEEAKKEDGVMVALDPFVVNLSDNNGNRFLKVTMQLEVAGPALMEKAKNKNPQIRDAIITLLTSKTSDLLMSPEGKLQLKDEVNIMANQILGNNSVKNVYLTDFVMQ
ncbi:MAG: flagellar basal body-associated FliL family protein [Alphaproteobacteria bacterium]|uniref:Flagellar protein FliL n=1 Tax=Candidatus Nitrobium versatile TaxID=2884831 RepID=A0A953J842_9BACT|nr:flagellar basal body-associated FliL family protein [Candidatus Nitrobium versatile]